MTGEDDEIDWVAFDHTVLQVFEEQEDRSGVLTYPLTSQRQALDFIKLMNRKGLPYQQMCATIGEKPETFRSWRLGNGNSCVGNAMMKRINRTIQETMNMTDVERDQVNMESDSFFDDIDSDHDSDGGLSSLEDAEEKEDIIPNGDKEHEPSPATANGEIAVEGSDFIDVVDGEKQNCSYSKSISQVTQLASGSEDKQTMPSIADDSQPNASLSEKKEDEMVTTDTFDVGTKSHTSEDNVVLTACSCSAEENLPNVNVDVSSCENKPVPASFPCDGLEPLSSVTTSTVESAALDTIPSVVLTEQSPINEASRVADETRDPSVVDVVDGTSRIEEPTANVDSEPKHDDSRVVEVATVETSRPDAVCETQVVSAEAKISVSDDCVITRECETAKDDDVKQITGNLATTDDTNSQNGTNNAADEKPNVVEEEPKVKYEASTKQLDLISRLALLKERASQRKSGIADGEATTSSPSDSSNTCRTVDESDHVSNRPTSETKVAAVPKVTVSPSPVAVNISSGDAGAVPRSTDAQRAVNAEEPVKSSGNETSLKASCDSNGSGITTRGDVEKVTVVPVATAVQGTSNSATVKEAFEETKEHVKENISKEQAELQANELKASPVVFTEAHRFGVSSQSVEKDRKPETTKVLNLPPETVLASNSIQITNEVAADCNQEKSVATTNSKPPRVKETSSAEVKNQITTVESGADASTVEPTTNHSVETAHVNRPTVPDKSEQMQSPVKKVQQPIVGIEQSQDNTKDYPSMPNNDKRPIESAPPSIQPVALPPPAPAPAATSNAKPCAVRDTTVAAPCKRGKAAVPAVRLVNVVLDNVFDGSVTLNYDSDLDFAATTEKTYALLDRVRKHKSSPVEAPGFLYVFTDSPKDAEVPRFLVGASRFPGKRLQQALCLNPDIRSFVAVAVTRRLEALRLARQKLEEFKVVGTIDWFSCTDDVITDTVVDIVGELKSKN